MPSCSKILPLAVDCIILHPQVSNRLQVLYAAVNTATKEDIAAPSDDDFWSRNLRTVCMCT